MLFHYGNCKREIKDLEGQLVTAMRQIQEGRAMYDYQVGILERELGARKCVAETMEKEIASLNEIISKKDDELKALRAVADRKETTELPTDRRQKKGKK